MIGSKKNRIKRIGSILLATFILSIISSFAVLSISAETTLSESEQKQARFNDLYANDEEFRSEVDKIRSLLSLGYLSDNGWLVYKQSFDKILFRMGSPSLDTMPSKDLEEFRKYVEHEAANLRNVKYESTFVEQTTLSPQSEIDLARPFVPKLWQPNADIQYPALNGVWKIYVDVHDQQIYDYYLPSYYIIEISIVWFDEDFPDAFLDGVYDTLRMSSWGRIQDIETFFICVHKTVMETKWLSFIACEIYWLGHGWRTIDPAYNNIDTFYYVLAPHMEGRVYEGYFQQTGEHPILWVNTWNHMMGQTDTNPTMADTSHDFWNWTIYWGNRYRTENEIIGSTWYDNERILELP